jgi:hypothetical protein
LLLALLVCGVGEGVQAATALDHLRAAARPKFKAGHTLPPLTRWGWAMPFDVQVELTEHWGYALEMGEVTAGVVKQLDDPASVPSKLVALTAKDPKRYPLSVLVHRPFYAKEFTDACPPETWSADPKTGQKVWSPEAPTAVFERGAALAAEPLGKVLAKAPIAILLNGGEYALSVYGHHGKIWEQDARVVKAKGERGWYEYVSEQKARQEMPVTEAVRKACPNRLLYIFYYADGCPHRNRYAGWDTWDHGYRWMRPVSDLPSSSIYYRHFNSGWTGDDDMLTQALHAVAQHIALKDDLSYNWLNAGWAREKMSDDAFGDLDRYAGYLKCYYTAGMIGGVAGYFEYPRGGFAGDVGPQPPHWLRQMRVLGEVHALFSHVEDFLRKSDLLPGPEKHKVSKDLPAYEFPTGDATARVVARKHRERDEWLVAAWAADGPAREVEATLPALGRVRVEARPGGSVYRATLQDGKPSLTRMEDAVR